MLTEASTAGAGSAELEPEGEAAPRSDGAPVTSVATSAGRGGGACNPPVPSAVDAPRLSALPPGRNRGDTRRCRRGRGCPCWRWSARSTARCPAQGHLRGTRKTRRRGLRPRYGRRSAKRCRALLRSTGAGSSRPSKGVQSGRTHSERTAEPAQKGTYRRKREAAGADQGRVAIPREPGGGVTFAHDRTARARLGCIDALARTGGMSLCNLFGEDDQRLGFPGLRPPGPKNTLGRVAASYWGV